MHAKLFTKLCITNITLRESYIWSVCIYRHVWLRYHIVDLVGVQVVWFNHNIVFLHQLKHPNFFNFFLLWHETKLQIIILHTIQYYYVYIVSKADMWMFSWSQYAYCQHIEYQPLLTAFLCLWGLGCLVPGLLCWLVGWCTEPSSHNMAKMTVRSIWHLSWWQYGPNWPPSLHPYTTNGLLPSNSRS